MFRVMIYKTPYTPKPKKENKLKNMIKMFSSDSLEVSIRRTRRTIHDYVLCNDFDIFVTFTFDPRKVNRYDMNSVYVKMQGWLWRQHQKDPNFKYIVVPEKHHDGAIHFHALMSDYPFELSKTNVIQDGKRVYNIKSYRFGFTNATHLPLNEEGARLKAANYIAKYITKDMPLLHNRRRYWCSKNLRKPLKHYNAIYRLGIANDINPLTIQSESDYNTSYLIPKSLQ